MLNDLVEWAGGKTDAAKAFLVGVFVDVSRNNIMEWSASSWATLIFIGFAMVFTLINELKD